MQIISVTPYITEIYTDLDTPVSLYLKLKGANTFFLESVTGGENVARYSYIGIDPIAEFKSNLQGDTAVQVNGDAAVVSENVLDAFSTFLDQFKFESIKGLPRFGAGAVGYFSWEIMAHIEPVQFEDKAEPDFPLAHFLVPRTLVVYDHAFRKVQVITLVINNEWDIAKAKNAEVIKRLSTSQVLPEITPLPGQIDAFKSVESNHTQFEFEAAVEKAKSHIFEGDVFQIVLSQRFQLNSKKLPFDVYRHLRMINPSPYMYYMELEEGTIIGASPEILVRLEDGTATLRPIAGTRPRSQDDEEVLIQELKEDEKEIAEHIMLVDLGRNDLGRVCEYTSIKVDELFAVERYSHVLHMVTNVQGQLKAGCTAVDLFKATFPAGTVSGAPKIRAVELIESIEPTRRGLYAGALGYFDFRGNMDLCIAIRTLVHRDNTYRIQAGAGLVADSVPSTEYEESRNKAKGMILACHEGVS